MKLRDLLSSCALRELKHPSPSFQYGFAFSAASRHVSCRKSALRGQELFAQSP